MRKTIFFILMAFLLFVTGCGVGEEIEAVVGFRPDKYWEEIWKIEARETHLELSPDRAVAEAICRIKYLGEKPAENVRIIVRSPLTYRLIDDEQAAVFQIIQPGEEIEYYLKLEESSWQEKIIVGIFEDKLKEDFAVNSYVQVTWRYGEEEYSVQFFDWGSAHH